MIDLSEKASAYCGKNAPALELQEMNELLLELDNWSLIDEHHLEKRIETKNFEQGLSLVNSIGEIAELEGHHPDLHLSFRSLRITIWTHSIDKLTRGDYILAKRIDIFLKDSLEA